MKKKSDSQLEPSEEYKRFKDLAKKLVAVSKKEMDRRLKDADERGAPKKTAA